MRSALSPDTTTRNAVRTHPTATMATHTIVLIDDDRSWAEATAELLRAAGFDVQAAMDGQEGLELLEQTVPVLVILDVHLPRIGGFGVLHEFRQQCRRVPVLMVSSEDQAGLIAQALAEGASCFLRKPMAPDLLLRAVRRLVRAPAGNG